MKPAPPILDMCPRKERTLYRKVVGKTEEQEIITAQIETCKGVARLLVTVGGYLYATRRAKNEALALHRELPFIMADIMTRRGSFAIAA